MFLYQHLMVCIGGCSLELLSSGKFITHVVNGGCGGGGGTFQSSFVLLAFDIGYTTSHIYLLGCSIVYSGVVVSSTLVASIAILVSFTITLFQLPWHVG